MSRNFHRRLVCVAAMALLGPLGLLCRFVPMGLPQVIVKYAGSFLWAAMVYLLVAVLLPQLRPISTGILAAAIAVVVEFVKLIHSPELDAFRATFAGKVLLGRFFSLKDIAAYWIAILGAVWIDLWIEDRAAHRTHAAKS